MNGTVKGYITSDIFNYLSGAEVILEVMLPLLSSWFH
jgi:hypothetical protein